MWRSLFFDDNVAPGGGDASPQNYGASAMTMDEIEQSLAAVKEPEAPKESSAFEIALRISEEARQRAEEKLQGPKNETSTGPTIIKTADRPVEAIEMLSDEDIQKLVDEKGMAAAMRAVQAQTFKLAERHLESRLSGMQQANVTAAEKDAQTKYATEFELFGDDIRTIIANAPDKSALGNPATWDSMIAYVRGKDGNIQRYVERLNGKTSTQKETEAKEAQRAAAGSHVPAGGSTRQAGRVEAGSDGSYGLDATERQIADNLGRTYADYAKWKRMGS